MVCAPHSVSGALRCSASRVLRPSDVGAVAIGSLAIGALAIGRIIVGRARIRRLSIGELEVGDLRVTGMLEAPQPIPVERAERQAS